MTPVESWLLIIIAGGTITLAVLALQGLIDHLLRVWAARRAWDEHTAQALAQAAERHPSHRDDGADQ